MNHFVIAAAASAMLVGGGVAAVAPAAQPAEVPGIMNPEIGGQAMLASRDVVDNIAASPEHTRFVAALKDSGMSATLKGKGPFTVFAPTDEAFARANMKVASRADAARAVDYLVVKGKLDSQALLRAINENGGQAHLKTLEGGTLVATMNGPTNIVLIDEKGNRVPISTYDVYDANGVTHVIDKLVQAD
ncbi:MAG TPA: fasciclin domain-containing protein [Rhizomicrobium sp.]|jgi:uncharacterized surface protein with fasciclin (FAS1) repeats|nr:fasciclin domain-containing protein [Rhizomicrobium sp.]